jgi:mRNA interferase RelE/StbE
MLTLVISEEAAKFLDRIPHKHAQQIVGKLDKIAENPESVPSIQLSGFPHLRRAKSGEYRMIYRISGELLELYVLKIGKRNDGEVYKNLENLSH